jgi:hypothetical protein
MSIFVGDDVVVTMTLSGVTGDLIRVGGLHGEVDAMLYVLALFSEQKCLVLTLLCCKKFYLAIDLRGTIATLLARTPMNLKEEEEVKKEGKPNPP